MAFYDHSPWQMPQTTLRPGWRDAAPPMFHHQTSWTSNGRSHSFHTASYSGPNTFFASWSGSVEGIPMSNRRRSSRPGGLLGTAFGMLDNVMSVQADPPYRGQPSRSAPRHVFMEDRNDDDNFDYGDLTHFDDEDVWGPSNLRSTHEGRPSKSRGHARSRPKSPARTRSRQEATPRLQRTRTSSPDASNQNSHARERSRHHDRQDSRRLQRDLDRHFWETDRTAKWVEDAVWDKNLTAGDVEAIQADDRAAQRAVGDTFDEMSAARGHEKREQSTGRHHRSRRNRPSHREPFVILEEDEDLFGSFPFNDFDDGPFGNFRDAGFGGHGHAFGHSFGGEPVFNVFPDHDPFDFDDILHNFFRDNNAQSFTFEEMPRAKGKHSKKRTHHPRPQQPQSTTSRSWPQQPQQQPPVVKVLTSAQAKTHFKRYDEQWKTLSSADPNIPWPAKDLLSTGLSDRSTIWAPRITSPVATWSEETVMKANVQAFFLGAVGLSPAYTEMPGTGRVEMGFDMSRASAKQVEDLLGLLKKERIRWHSDRLGRRNAGMVGPNEALQRDDRARAVFHAVCELIDAAQ